MTKEVPMTQGRMTGRKERRMGVAKPARLLGAFAFVTCAQTSGGSAESAFGEKRSASAEHSQSTRFVIRHSAFTLIEMLVVLSIITLMLGISIISIAGVKEEDRLRRAVAMMETTARDNLLQAVKDQRLVRMSLATSSFGSASDFGGKLEIRRVGERDFRMPKRGEIWEFSPTGICEPIEVRFSGSGGTVELAFDALTACAKRKTLDFNAKG